MKLVSINRAHKQQIEFDGKLVDAGLFKEPVHLWVYLSSAGSDTIANLSEYAGADQAV